MPALHRLPIRARLTLLQVGVFGLLFGSLCLVLIANQRETLQNNAQESLELTARVVVDRLVDQDSDLSSILAQATIPGERGSPEVIGQLIGAAGTVVESDGSGATVRPLVGSATIRTARRDGHWHHRVRLPGRAADDIVVVVSLTDGSHAGELLVLAQTLDVVERSVSRLERLLLTIFPVGLALQALGGWFVARAALRPVHELTRRAAAVTPGAEFVELPVPPANDELAGLARTLNSMLTRLSTALDAERRFTADASHELRTPLGIMEAELDVALRSSRTPPEAKEVLISVKEEAETLARIVANLLVLARSEAVGAVAVARQDVDLFDLALEVTRRLRLRARERGVDLGVGGGPSVVRADPDLLRQALTNLVDNAIGHTPAGGSVTVTVADGAAPSVLVADTGAGIPAEELDRIFDRFYRVDRARQRGGAGLGLEITRRIVEAHGGNLSVTSTPGAGSTFTISLGADPPG